MIDLRCRPIDEWIGPRTWGPNMKKAPFGATWERTRKDLIRELEILDARDVLIGLDVRADQIRQDGWPKGNVSAPPAVSLTFTSTHGPLRYQCDRWDRWHSNLRAIGLVLQRQRLVNEAGVGASDQVYRGFSALPPGGAIAVPGAMTFDEACELLGAAVSTPHASQALRRGLLTAHDVWRGAAKVHHPDAGGDPEFFRRLTDARDLIARSVA